MCVVHAKNNPFKPQKLLVLGILPVRFVWNLVQHSTDTIRYDEEKKIRENWFSCYFIINARNE